MFIFEQIQVLTLLITSSLLRRKAGSLWIEAKLEAIKNYFVKKKLKVGEAAVTPR
jgi:hypothetical protein